MYWSDDVVPLLIANVFLQSADLFFCNSLFFKNQDFMGKSDPYLEFSRPMPDGKLQAVHRTEVQMCHIVAVQCRLYHACSQFFINFHILHDQSFNYKAAGIDFSLLTLFTMY